MSPIIETPRSGADARIDIHDDAACRYWCARLGVRPKALKYILRQVGNRVADVEAYLAESELHEYVEYDDTEPKPK